MRWFFFFLSTIIFLGCTTVGVKDIASSEEKKSETEKRQANLTSSEEKTPLNSIQSSHSSSSHPSKHHSHSSETSTDNHSSSHSNSSETSWEIITPDRKPSSLEVECWNCKGVVKEFICAAQSYNQGELPQGISYYCKIGRLTRHDEKAKDGEKDTDIGLCPQCKGTRRCICWICKGKGKILQQ